LAVLRVGARLTGAHVTHYPPLDWLFSEGRAELWETDPAAPRWGEDVGSKYDQGTESLRVLLPSSSAGQDKLLRESGV
jgi:hypothetical protein